MSRNIETWSSDNFIYDLRQYRAPFEIYAAAWNSRFDLLALASRNGDVVVKRFYWKIGWKRELSTEQGTISKSEASSISLTSKIESICWSPNGDILAVSMANGLLHLLDAQVGKIRYTCKFDDPIRSMKWQCVLNVNELNGEEDFIFSSIYPSDFVVNEETNPEGLQKMAELEEFCKTTLVKSLAGTMLFGMATNDPVVYVISAGILPITTIRPDITSFDGVDPFSLEILDVLYLSSRKVQVVCNCTGFGQPKFHNEWELSVDHQIGTNTYVIEYDMGWVETRNLKFLSRFAINRYKMWYISVYMNEMYKHTVESWESQSHFFHNRLLARGQAVMDEFTKMKGEEPRDFLPELFLVVLTGHISPPMLEFIQKDLQSNGLKSMTEFVDEQFPVLIRGLTFLLSAAKLLQLYSSQFLDEFNEFSQLISADKIDMDNMNEIADLDNFLNMLAGPSNSKLGDKMKTLIETSLLLQQFLTDMSSIAEANRKELKYLIRWLSKLTSEKKSPDGKTTENLHSNKRFAMREVSEFLATTVDKVQSNYENYENLEARMLKSLLQDDDVYPSRNSLTEKAINGCAMDRVLPFLKEGRSIAYLENCPKTIAYDSKIDSARFLSTCEQKFKLIELLRKSEKLLEDIGTILINNQTISIKQDRVYTIDLVHSHAITKAFLIDSDAVKHQLETINERPNSVPDLNLIELSAFLDEMDRFKCQSFLLGYRSDLKVASCFALLQKTENDVDSYNNFVSNPADQNKVLLINWLGNAGKAQSSVEKTPKEPLTIYIHGLEKGAPYHILDIHPYGLGRYFGSIRLLEGERVGQTFIFRANMFDRKVSIDLNSTLFTDIEMLRLSEKRALGIVVATCKTKLIWFDLEGDFEETQVDEADGDIEDEECFTDAIEHIETDSNGSAYEDRISPIRFDSPININS